MRKITADEIAWIDGQRELDEMFGITSEDLQRSQQMPWLGHLLLGHLKQSR